MSDVGNTVIIVEVKPGDKNADVFKQVFGYPPSPNARCVAPKKICENYDDCKKCPFANWWNKEYKECFVLKENFDENNQT